jgi:hypothetical protein
VLLWRLFRAAHVDGRLAGEDDIAPHDDAVGVDLCMQASPELVDGAADGADLCLLSALEIVERAADGADFPRQVRDGLVDGIAVIDALLELLVHDRDCDADGDNRDDRKDERDPCAGLHVASSNLLEEK